MRLVQQQASARGGRLLARTRVQPRGGKENRTLSSLEKPEHATAALWLVVATRAADVGSDANEFLGVRNAWRADGREPYASRCGDRTTTRSRHPGELRDRWPLVRRERDAGESLARKIVGVRRSDAIRRNACNARQRQDMAVRTVIHVGGVDRQLLWNAIVIARHGMYIGDGVAAAGRGPVQPRLFGDRCIAVMRVRQQMLHRREQNAEHDEQRAYRASKSESSSLRTGHDVAARCSVWSALSVKQRVSPRRP